MQGYLREFVRVSGLMIPYYGQGDVCENLCQIASLTKTFICKSTVYSNSGDLVMKGLQKISTQPSKGDLETACISAMFLILSFIFSAPMTSIHKVSFSLQLLCYSVLGFHCFSFDFLDFSTNSFYFLSCCFRIHKTFNIILDIYFQQCLCCS